MLKLKMDTNFKSILKMENWKICRGKWKLLSVKLNYHVTFSLDVRVGPETRSNSKTTVN